MALTGARLARAVLDGLRSGRVALYERSSGLLPIVAVDHPLALRAGEQPKVPTIGPSIHPFGTVTHE
ncbi:MAG: hypothetical protein DLM64_15770 [Solirubrobacterales bacterium]|nr:MAG: hypothetical protein DLM64_15770 [Solirubrobacterales bacterium]